MVTRRPTLDRDARVVLAMLRDEQVYGASDPLGMTQDEIGRTTAHLQRLGLVDGGRALTAAGWEWLRAAGR